MLNIIDQWKFKQYKAIYFLPLNLVKVRKLNNAVCWWGYRTFLNSGRRTEEVSLLERNLALLGPVKVCMYPKAQQLCSQV